MAKIIRDMLEDTLNAEPDVNKFRIVWIKSVTRGPMMHDVEMDTEFASPEVIANVFGNIEMEVDALIEDVRKEEQANAREKYEHRLINIEDTYKKRDEEQKIKLTEFEQERGKLLEHNTYLLKSNDELVAQIDALKEEVNANPTDRSTALLIQHMGEEINFLRSMLSNVPLFVGDGKVVKLHN